jgi:hypothetical protein
MAFVPSVACMVTVFLSGIGPLQLISAGKLWEELGGI